MNMKMGEKSSVSAEHWAEIAEQPHFVITMTDDELDRIIAALNDPDADPDIEFNIEIIGKGFQKTDEGIEAIIRIGRDLFGA